MVAPISGKERGFVEGAAFLGDLIQGEQQSLSGYERNRMFQNLGGGKFADVGALAGVDLIEDGRAIVTADLDGDGGLDLLLSNRNSPRLIVLRNQAKQRGGWLRVALEGVDSNRQGVGARLRLRAGGREQVREVQIGNGFVGQSDTAAWFGLGEASGGEELKVVWPSGRQQRLTEGLEGGRTLWIREPDHAGD
ncbi:MAG TPA: ASPIC/UnbV domain-containing protein [Verrucomicrobiales bacterium]|nr:ASPIC/UnbV domain-containing protein [Verrucomicrobiales bacterium]